MNYSSFPPRGSLPIWFCSWRCSGSEIARKSRSECADLRAGSGRLLNVNRSSRHWDSATGGVGARTCLYARSMRGLRRTGISAKSRTDEAGVPPQVQRDVRRIVRHYDAWDRSQASAGFLHLLAPWASGPLRKQLARRVILIGREVVHRGNEHPLRSLSGLRVVNAPAQILAGMARRRPDRALTFSFP